MSGGVFTAILCPVALFYLIKVVLWPGADIPGFPKHIVHYLFYMSE